MTSAPCSVPLKLHQIKLTYFKRGNISQYSRPPVLPIGLDLAALFILN